MIGHKFIDIQSELGFSLTETKERHENAISATPVFQKPAEIELDVFVIMPFLKELDPTYAIIRDVCNELKVNVVRGNELFEVSHVINDIWSAIFFARAIICDCTQRNPNVFYELGIAHTLGKKVMLISRNGDDIPFDLRHWRHFIYNDARDGLYAGIREALTRIFTGDTRVLRPRQLGAGLEVVPGMDQLWTHEER
jgi:hypothetical protein